MPLRIFGKRLRGVPTDRITKAMKSGTAGKLQMQLRPRRRALWAPCTLYWFPDGQMRGVCMDISDTGARVRFQNQAHLPAELRLVSAQLGLNRTCLLVRRDGNDAAFRFND